MSERLAALATIIAAKLLARRLKKKKRKEEERRPRKTITPEEKKMYPSATKYIFGEASKELGREIGSPYRNIEVHSKGWELPFQSHPQLGDLDRWKEYVKRRAWLSANVGSLLSLPLYSGTTAIILTRDGRLFHLPHGEDDFETATNVWEPFFQYIERKARKIVSERRISFNQAVEEVLRELGLKSSSPYMREDDDMRGQAEVVIFADHEPPEKKKQFLHTLKKIYMDELGLDWMPIPLVHSDLHDVEIENSGFRKSNQIYIEEIPNILRELGINPEDPTIKKRLQALQGLLHKIHWPDYWDARTALALAEALHAEGKITDQEYLEFLDLAARGDSLKLIAKAQELAEKHAPLEEEEKPSGAPVLARPDRYPTLTQKILLKTLILGEHLREDNKGVHRDLYRALRNLLTTPLTTSNWYPLLTEWFENLEKGQHISPLTQIIQKLPIHPTVKQEAYRYLAHIEQGKPIDQIPEEEKRAFKRVIEQIKQAIWLNPQRYAPVLEQLAYATGMNQKDAVKALIGIIDDLAKVYTGEKSPRQVGIERDATQVYHTIKNLQDRGNYIDPYQLTQTLTNIIEQHIQDPLLREAYKQAIKHYQETHHLIPRSLDYLEKIMEKERELEEKLKQLAHGERKLTELETKRIAALYRTLMLLTPYPTLKETKRFYFQLVERIKIRVGNEKFIPVHGPVCSEVASAFQRIVIARQKEKDHVAKMEMAGFEPLFYTTPHLALKVESILSGIVGEVVPLETHQGFVVFVSRSQTRFPLE